MAVEDSVVKLPSIEPSLSVADRLLPEGTLARFEEAERASLWKGDSSGPDAPSRTYLTLKRAFDVTSAGLGLAVLSPLLLGTAVAVRATSEGPAIFKQERYGKDNVPFTCYKFRSMTVDTPSNVPTSVMNENPSVMTPIGAFLRKTSLAPVIIGTPGDGEPTKSLSHPENSSLDLQQCERRPGTSLGARHHYTSFQFLSFAVFGGPEGTSGRHLCAFARAPFAAVGTEA